MTKRFYNKKEAAEALGVSLPTIENYVRKGLLTPLYPAGERGTVRFSADQVENFFSPSKAGLSDC